eukprot:TRINITY_DN30663_c0_g1_i1.p1 TRINITY_DN30663_c0_g1~~TRINITY_DN30663_c0_g1_i1.p1  ORF type:complete len:454 (+),score=44.96 TRINITY_DN30663_c0_g1_i1:51-1364(+)
MPYNLSIQEAVVMYPLPPEREYVVYRIVCKWGEKRCVSDHRYSEFRNFHKRMKKVSCGERGCRYGTAALPWRMATKKANHTPGKIKKRRAELEKYIQVLGSVPLCRGHERGLNRFIDLTNGSSVMQGSEEATFVAGKRTDKSFWGFELLKKDLAPAYTGLSIQLLDTAFCKVLDGNFRINCHSNPGTPVNQIREKVKEVTEIFQGTLTPTAFPSSNTVFKRIQIGSKQERKKRFVSPPDSPTTRRKKSKEPHPLHCAGSVAPDNIDEIFQCVWKGNNTQVVPITDRVMNRPIVRFLAPLLYPLVCEGQIVSKQISMQFCRDILTWATSCQCKVALSLCVGSDPSSVLSHIVSCLPEPGVGELPTIVIQNTDFSSNLIYGGPGLSCKRRGSLGSSSCGMSSEGPSVPDLDTPRCDYLSVKVNEKSEACLKTIKRARKK